MSERGKEIIKDLLHFFPFYILAQVSKYIYEEKTLAGLLFMCVSIASYYVFIRSIKKDWDRRTVIIHVGIATGILLIVVMR